MKNKQITWRRWQVKDHSEGNQVFVLFPGDGLLYFFFHQAHGNFVTAYSTPDHYQADRRRVMRMSRALDASDEADKMFLQAELVKRGLM